MALAHRCQTVVAPANISGICTLWKMRQRLRSAAGGVWCSREVLGNHPRKSPRRWMELRLYDDYGWQRPINLGCGPRSARTPEALLCTQIKSCLPFSNSNPQFLPYSLERSNSVIAPFGNSSFNRILAPVALVST